MAGQHRVAEVKYPEAEELADLFGIQLDLGDAKRLCDHALTLPDMGVAHSEIVDGLVVAALTKYMRCFAGGSRLGLKESDVKALSSELQRAHDFFKHLRNKHVAHPVNPLEDTFVTASVSEVDGELLPITSLNPGRETILLSIGDAEKISELAQAIALHIKPRIEKRKSELLEFLQSLPIEEVRNLDLHNPRPGHAERYVKNSRKQATRSNNRLQPTGEDAGR